MDLFSKINWVDIFIFILVLRACFIGIKAGLAVEAFKFLGVIASIFISFQFYFKLAGFLKTYLPLKPYFIEDISFLILAIASYLAFVLLRNLFLSIFKFEATNSVEKIIGSALGFLRGIMLAGLILAFLVLFNDQYLNKSIRKSLLGRQVLNSSTATYNFIFDKIAKSFISKDCKNNSLDSFQLIK